MHRDALADLGAALRRELRDPLHDDPAAPVGLAEDAQRWLETLDGDIQALAAWLTSTAVWTDLPLAVPPPEEAVPDRRISGPAGALRARWVSEKPSPQEPHPPAPLSHRPYTDRERGEEDRRGRKSDRESSDSPLPGEGGVMGEGPGVRGPVAHIGSPQPAARDDRPANGQRSASPALMETPRDEAERSELAPPETGAPPQNAIGAFTPARNLHDLARLLSVGDYKALPPLETAVPSHLPSKPPPGAGRDLTEQPRQETFLARSLPWTGEGGARDGGDSGRESPKPSRDTPPAAGMAGGRTAAPFQNDAPEVDLETILEALERSVAEEYRRFYGS